MDFFHIMHQLNELIAHSANQWWVVPMVTLFCLIDGFFLFLPSETAIVALAAISVQNGQPNVWLLLAGGAVGAIIGDNIAYWLGRKLGTTRFKWMRRPRAAKAFDWAKMELNKRGAVLIFTARYIPVGRIAVNFTAGATKFSWRRFFLLDFLAAFTWAAYGVSIGTLSGSFHFLHSNPLIGIGIAIVFAIIMGFVVDHAMKWLHGVLDRRAKAKLVLAAPAPVPAGVPGGLAAEGTDAAGASSTAGPAAGN